MSARWLVNGEQAGVDPSDRGLGYGDGLFETMAAGEGAIRLLDLHLERLATGCERLSITTPPRDTLEREIARVTPAGGRAVVKLIVTRGPGGRGYAPAPEHTPTRIVAATPWPDYPDHLYRDGIAVHVCDLRLGRSTALAGLKHLCRLEYVMAQLELRGRDARQGLLLDSSGFVVGGTSSNVFIANEGRLLTPAVTHCGVAGVMRRVVLAAARGLGLHAEERELTLPEILAADEIFMTNAVFGIWPVTSLDSRRLVVGPITRRLLEKLEYAARG